MNFYEVIYLCQVSILPWLLIAFSGLFNGRNTVSIFRHDIKVSGFIFETYIEIFGSDFQGFAEIFGLSFNPKVVGPHRSKVSYPPLGIPVEYSSVQNSCHAEGLYFTKAN